LLTSIVFAVETTGQSNALLPLLAACLASYGISYLLMKNTIMTEKIARRGVATPSVYEPDVLNNFTVQDVLQNDGLVISYQATLAEVREWLQRHKQHQQNYYVIADDGGKFQGLVSSSNLFSLHHAADCTVGSLIRRKPFLINSNESLRTAVELMARENVDVLPVKGADQQEIIGVLSYQNILTAYRLRAAEHEENIAISIRRRTLKILLHGKKRLSTLQTTVKE
jgi:predicted transcriptional regulator